MKTVQTKNVDQEAIEIVNRYLTLGEDIYEYLNVLKHQIIQKKESNDPNQNLEAEYDEKLLAAVKKYWKEGQQL
ncbi:hypothetical protein [Spiroplasma eriocheiris]|uniref:Uncharacterized protein n=1 Tax=Spiroplasma eriocheiris TaxID=315358 RepID=A0A0H3XIU8_9MOLU|nr:hypothetical protein [Spiroplasma eriocheiris]AHF57215.1 hypothetical protein SPE_0079 [Spiroplasma eriocheiris CCTCC M 207170]AKM53681.1 hypothetical protein SERIO_v1c00790 [Spiroplasma eriocheiris]